ncbi:MAG: beta-ketoacyl-ACP synthase 3 [bacterium]
MDVYIRSLGAFLPPQVVTNDDIVARTGGTAQWIVEHTGIVERRFVAPGMTNSMMAEHAARDALSEGKLAASDLDALIFATLSPDAGFPGSGVFLQRHLGIAGVPALDVRNQCSGFLYGLSIAKAWLTSRTYSRLLLVGSEIQSTGLDFSEAGRSVASLFGDGAGAAVLDTTSTTGGRVVDVRLGADGKGAEALWCELPASGLHPNIDATYLAEGRQFPQMQGRTVFRRAVETLERELNALLRDHQLAPQDVLLVPHQSSKFLNGRCKRVEFLLHNIVSTIEHYGNTTAASLPIGLHHASQTGRLAGPVVLAAFGSGYTWGSALLEWPT